MQVAKFLITALLLLLLQPFPLAKKNPPSLHHCVVGPPSRSKFSRRRRGKKRGLPVPKRTFSPLLSVKKTNFPLSPRFAENTAIFLFPLRSYPLPIPPRKSAQGRESIRFFVGHSFLQSICRHFFPPFLFLLLSTYQQAQKSFSDFAGTVLLVAPPSFLSRIHRMFNHQRPDEHRGVSHAL